MLPPKRNISPIFATPLYTSHIKINGCWISCVKNPKLFKKVRKFYENNGIVFSGDPLDDYEMLMDQVAIDLETVEVV